MSVAHQLQKRNEIMSLSSVVESIKGFDFSTWPTLLGFDVVVMLGLLGAYALCVSIDKMVNNGQ